jgi:hypothetical protein
MTTQDAQGNLHDGSNGQFTGKNLRDGDVTDLIGDEPELPRVSLQPRNRTLDHYLYVQRRPRFDVAQDYQRGSVWGDDRRRDLLKSIIQGLPIGSIIINDRGYQSDGSPDTAVIDGKQRLEALWAFEDDEFAIPAGWFPPEEQEKFGDIEPVEYNGRTVRGVRYSQTSERFHRKFANLPMPTLEAEGLTYQQEADVFYLINAGGVPQDQETIDRAAAIAGRTV